MKTSQFALISFLAPIAWADNFQSREHVASPRRTRSIMSGTLGKSISFRTSQLEFPMVFFAKENEVYHPLHSVLSYEDAQVFAYGKSEPPTEIILHNEYAKSATDSVFAGFKDEFFALGSGEAFDLFKIRVDENGKVQCRTLFSCLSEFSGFHRIVIYNGNPSRCFEIEIFIGRYNPRTGQYIKVDFGADGKERKAPARNPRRKWKNWWY